MPRPAASPDDDPSTPTAPPLAQGLPRLSTGDLELPLVQTGTSSQGPSRAASVEEVTSESDATLWRDLLARAKGNHEQAARWMQQVGAAVPLAVTAAADMSDAQPDGDFDLAAQSAGAPATYFCPISFKVFRDPVLLPTGQTYERRYIARWLDQGNLRCPATGQRLERPVALTPNVALRHSIEAWALRNAPWMLEPSGRVKPIPAADDFAAPARSSSSAAPMDPDLAMALRLQEQELSHFATRRRQRAGGSGGPSTTSRNPLLQSPGLSRLPAYSSTEQPAAEQRRGSLYTGLSIALATAAAAYVILFIIALWFSDPAWQLAPLHQSPLAGPTASAYERLGGVYAGVLVRPSNQWWRVLVAPFLVSGIIDLFLCEMCLWTFGRHLGGLLPHPALSIPAIYMAGGIVGALASANLAPTLVAVGAGSGVLSLIGGTWADQLLNWRSYSRQWLTLPILVVATGAFIVLGFTPLENNFYRIAGLVTGFLAGTAFFLQGKGRQTTCGRPTSLLLQLVCATVLIGALVVGVIGIEVADGQVAEDCSWCRSFACLDVPWWNCNATALTVVPQPNCGLTSYGNGTAALQCPQSGSTTVSLGNNPSAGELARLCAISCVVSADPSASAPPLGESGTRRTDLSPSSSPASSPPSASPSPSSNRYSPSSTANNGTLRTDLPTG